jgi:7,8-dihydropterin-6-yl-methyl-4-(beta-D-ribofuranosyl)aminobenzene 5'-phosphate synthase
MIQRIIILVSVLSLSLVAMLPSRLVMADIVSANSAQVTILSSNLANGSTIGEWGFSALVEADGRCVLFDTGNYSDTALRNANVLSVDLSCVTDVVLSHWHSDHMGGLVTLMQDTWSKNPGAMKRVHVAEGLFQSRRVAGRAGDSELNQMIQIRDRLEAQGVEFKVYAKATEILPSIWVTGPIDRVHGEKNYSSNIDVKNIDGDWIQDTVPESQGLIIVTDEGPIVLLGCGHAGSVNLLEQVQREIQDHSILALMGGMHLFSATDETLNWTSDKLNGIGVQHLMAGHCTGVEPMFRLRSGLNLDRKTAVIGAVGSRFVLGEGIYPTAIAQ